MIYLTMRIVCCFEEDKWRGNFEVSELKTSRLYVFKDFIFLRSIYGLPTRWIFLMQYFSPFKELIKNYGNTC